MSYYRQGPSRPGGSGITIGLPPVTPTVKLLMMICGGIWLAQMVIQLLGGPRAGYAVTQWLGLVPEHVVFHGRLWQPLTYIFLHSTASVFHLIFNMLMLYMFGGELERHWGRKGFIRYFLVAGAGGGLFATALGWVPGNDPGIPTIGASGAVYGLIMAFGLIFADRTILFMMIFPMKARTMAMIMFGVTLLNTLTQAGSPVSHIGHLGGAVVGVAYLKRAWRLGDFYREIRWKIRRRRFKVMDDKNDFDRWVN